MTRLVEEAVLANAAGAPMRAETRLSRATRLLDDVPDDEASRALQARIDITLALARFTRGDRHRAFEALDEADRLLADLSPTPLHSLAVAQRATLHGRSGEWRVAHDLLVNIDTSRREVSPRTRALVNLNLGLACQFLGDYVGSDARLRRAHQIATAHGFDDLGAAAVHNRGRLQMLLGNLPRSMSLMDEAWRTWPDLLPPAALLDSARVLAEAGLVDRARQVLDDGEAAARRGRIAHDVAETDLERARLALLRGEVDDARRLAARAESRFARVAEPAWATRAALLRMESDLVRRRRVHRLADEALHLSEGAAQRSAVGTEAVLLAAEAAALAGRALDAERLLRLPIVRRTRAFPLRLRRELAAAEMHLAEGDTRTARSRLRRGASLLAAEQARYTSIEGRTAVALHTRRLRDLHVDLAIRGGSASEVFAVTELWRAVSQRLPPVTASADPEVARLTADARRWHAEALEERDPERRASLDDLARRAEEAIWHRDLHTSSGAGDGRGPNGARATTVHALAPRLAETGTGVVSLFLHRGRLWCVTVTAGGARVSRVPEGDQVMDHAVRLRADLAALQHAAGTPIRDAVARSLRRDADRLGALLAPVLPETTRLVILSSRGVASVPWRMVPGIAGRPVVVAPSATFWQQRRVDAPPDTVRLSSSTPPDGDEPPKVVALAGPGLHRADDEARTVAEVWGDAGRPLIGSASSGQALAEALRDATIVHVAAHGVHHEESPLFSSVLMADGPQWVHEVQRVGVGAQHVVLSSCEVGRTHMREGEEGLGLTAGLIACGVRSVVAAVAPVGDDAAAELMEAYHRRLATGLDAAEALEQASVGIEGAALFATYGSDWLAAEANPSAQMKIAGSAKSAS